MSYAYVSCNYPQDICTFFEPCARCENGDQSVLGCGHPDYSACNTDMDFMYQPLNDTGEDFGMQKPPPPF